MTNEEDKPPNFPQGMWYTFINPENTSMYTPSPYGILVSFVYGGECAQLWFQQGSGVIYHRQGNNAGWGGASSGQNYEATHGWHVLDGTYTQNKT